MKKLFAMLLCAALIVTCFAGCGNKMKTTVEDVKKSGELVVATSPDFPPFESLEDNKVVGIEPEILEFICKELDVELKIEQMDFDSVLNGISSGKYDLAASGISVTPDREKNMLFTDPYCLAAQAIVVVEGSAVASKADLEGKKISAQTGTTAEEFCMGEGYDVSAFAANNDAQLALVNGKVDAWVIDDLTAAEMVAAYNETADKKLVILDEAMTTEPYAFAFPKGCEDIVTEVNAIINDLVANGTIKTIFDNNAAPYTSPAK